MNLVDEQWEQKKQSFPSYTRKLKMSLSFSRTEIDKIFQKNIPLSMDDKWYVSVHEGSIDIYRSWTGKHVYRLPFVIENFRYKINELFVNRQEFSFFFVWIYPHKKIIKLILS